MQVRWLLLNTRDLHLHSLFGCQSKAKEYLATDPNRQCNATRPARWVPRLRQHLAWVIAVKLALIALLFTLFFSPEHRPEIDPSGVSDRLRLDR